MQTCRSQIVGASLRRGDVGSVSTRLVDATSRCQLICSTLSNITIRRQC